MAESENGLNQIKAQIEQLPVEEKIRLVQDLLSGSGLQVVGVWLGKLSFSAN
jgi:hypothetical protein